MVVAEPSTKFSDLLPIKAEPPLYHVWGFGLYLCGERDFDLETESFVRTLCFCLIYIPIFALRAYRVTPTEDGWSFLGRVPASTGARFFSMIATLAVLGGSGYLGFEAYWNSPEVVGSRNLAQADRLEAEGHADLAAPLLAVVAEGSSTKASLAQQRLAKMIGPTTKLDSKARRAALQAAVNLQKIGRWRGSASALQGRGVALAKEVAAADPAGAWLILEATAPLAPADQADAGLRHDLLERAVAADPSNVEWVSRLAVDCESRGELERCETLLTPLRTRLGESEGARVLAALDARANRFDEAIRLLRDYTKNRLDRLIHAEKQLQTLYTSLQKRVIKKLENEQVVDFDYESYRRASSSGREQIVIQYMERKAKEDKEISRAQEAMIVESQVVPAVMELGIILIQKAQAQNNPQARKSFLDEAEATFMAISLIAGNREDFQLSLAQVYYWQGRQREGRAILENVLKDHKRDPEWLLQVATILRNVGSDSEARKLVEEGFSHAVPGRAKSDCALMIAILSDETPERIEWLKKADTNDPQVKAMLSKEQSEQALEQGNEQQAITYLKQTISIYDSMPESSAILNNNWITMSRLAILTGDTAARDRADAMIARAAALAPSNSLTLHNASGSQLESALRDVIGSSIDLKLIKSRASLEFLDFLANDEAQREAYVARLRTHPGANRALSMMEKVILLAPENPSFYETPARLLAFRRDIEGLRKLLSSLNRSQLDLSNQAKRAKENQSGLRDKTNKGQAQAALTFLEPILPVARAKGGTAFAAAASLVIRSRIAAANYGVKADPNDVVTLAEEAFSRSPSLASQWYLVTALLFRAADRLAKADAEFAALRQRSFRSYSNSELFGVVLSINGPLRKKVLDDADVCRALELVHELHAAAPLYTTGLHWWSLLQARNPADATAMAALYSKNEWEPLYDEIVARLDPYDPSNTLKAYWRARMGNHEEEALKILKNADPNEFPVPIGSP